MESQGLGELIHGLEPSAKKQVRELERRSFKLCKQKNSVLFNETCLKEDILPKYTNIRLHDRVAKDETFTLKYRRSLVQRELDNAKKKIEVLESEISNAKTLLTNELNQETLQPILGTIEKLHHRLKCFAL